MNPIEQFHLERNERIARFANEKKLKQTAGDFMNETIKHQYSYNFSWMGRPIIAYPQDMIAMQEIIWDVKPDLIIETGVAHGGSIIYYASLLELLGGDGKVIGIDIDIRKHNREKIETHPMFKRIKLIEGSSIGKEVIEQVAGIVKDYKNIMVCLDSNHTHEHVLEELKLYSLFVTKGSYCVVFDTIVEHISAEFEPTERPWGIGNNPKTAVFEFLKSNDNFEIDKSIDNKLLISVAPDGFLKKVK